MKRLLPFCLLAAIFCASADITFPVNVSNYGIIEANSTVTINATKPTNDSEDTAYFLYCSVTNKSKDYSPIQLLLSSNGQSHEITMDYFNNHTLPHLATIDWGSETFTYRFADDETEVSVDVENLDQKNTATLYCLVIAGPRGPRL